MSLAEEVNQLNEADNHLRAAISILRGPLLERSDEEIRGHVEEFLEDEE